MEKWKPPHLIWQFQPYERTKMFDIKFLSYPRLELRHLFYTIACHQYVIHIYNKNCNFVFDSFNKLCAVYITLLVPKPQHSCKEPVKPSLERLFQSIKGLLQPTNLSNCRVRWESWWHIYIYFFSPNYHDGMNSSHLVSNSQCKLAA